MHSAHIFLNHLRSRAKRMARDFRRDTAGVAAVEFALIVPLMLVMYFVTLEAGQAIDTSKKIDRMASTVADLVTQQGSVTPTDLDAIMAIGKAIIQPYNRTVAGPTITVVGIQLDGTTPPKGKVVWSRGTAAPAKNSAIAVPANLALPNTFLVRVDAGLQYKPVVPWANGVLATFSEIKMGQTYHLRSRISTDVKCDTC